MSEGAHRYQKRMSKHMGASFLLVCLFCFSFTCLFVVILVVVVLDVFSM